MFTSAPRPLSRSYIYAILGVGYFMSIDPDDPVHEKFESVTGEPLGAYFGSIGDSIMTMLQARGRRGAEGDFAARARARLSAAPSLTRALAGSLPPPPPPPPSPAFSRSPLPSPLRALGRRCSRSTAG